MQRDAKQKAGVQSGTSHKEKITESDAQLGLHSVGKNEKSGANPKVPAGNGHFIK